MARKTVKPITKVVQEKVNCTALYIRVSTEKQVEEGFSIEAQESRLRSYCDAQQWHVCDKHVYIDAGISGKTMNGRDAFNAMMQSAKDGNIKRIVAIKLDRMARNTKDFLQIVDTLNQYNCDLVLIKESFDTGTPQGKFALTMFAAIAELEASTITERVMTGKAQKAIGGGYNGSACPLGYDYVNNEFVINEDSKTVKEIFERFVRGESQLSISNTLNAQGNKTKKGAMWSQSTVRYIITNGFYAGLAQWDNVEIEGTHTGIIDKSLYEKAHNKLMNSKRGNPNFSKKVD